MVNRLTHHQAETLIRWSATLYHQPGQDEICCSNVHLILIDYVVQTYVYAYIIQSKTISYIIKLYTI